MTIVFAFTEAGTDEDDYYTYDNDQIADNYLYNIYGIYEEEVKNKKAKMTRGAKEIDPENWTPYADEEWVRLNYLSILYRNPRQIRINR
jgi:hypothetical protein